MDRALILHIEDEKLWQNSVASQLDGSNHMVIENSTNLTTAERALKRIADGRLLANVVIFNCNLGYRYDGSPAEVVLSDIERFSLKVRTINLGTIPIGGFGLRVDVDLPKGEVVGSSHIARILDGLAEPEA